MKAYFTLLNPLDDACTFVRHSFSQYPVLSQLAFGEKLGCFEKPSSDKDPMPNIDCPDITPLMFCGNKVNRDAMKVDSRLVHPDTNSLTKYCLGTRLQMRKGKTSHKLKTCEYHNANLSKQGKLLKTMTQEAMQVKWKFSLPNSYGPIYWLADTDTSVTAICYITIGYFDIGFGYSDRPK